MEKYLSNKNLKLNFREKIFAGQKKFPKKFLAKLLTTATIFFCANNFCYAETLDELQTKLNHEAEAYFATRNLIEQDVMGIAWRQNAAEYHALCYQAYNAVKKQVDAAILEEHEKPLAIVLDVDETVLDNSKFHASYIGDGKKHARTDWVDWTNSLKADAMPGAVDCLNYVASKNVEIFYISNRHLTTEMDGTIKNLRDLGFPSADRNHMLFKTDTSDKMPRFEEVMKNYDVILFMGDNVGDFPLSTFGKSTETRNSIIDGNKDNFGTKFIAFPNSTYGNWEEALAKDYKKLSAEQKDTVRKNSIKIWSAEQNKISPLLAKTKTAQNSNQIILVVDNNLSLWNKNSAGIWQKDFETFCGHGSGGFNEKRREGDASTPVGSFPILYAFGVPENPGTNLEYKKITENSYLSAEAGTYNTWVESETPLKNGEHLIEVYQYTYGMNIGFNISPAVVGRGSAVFIHCKGLGRWTTAAGISLREEDMVELLKKTSSGAQIIIVPKVEDIAKY